MTPRRALLRVILTIAVLFIGGAILVPLLSRESQKTLSYGASEATAIAITVDRGRVQVRPGDRFEIRADGRYMLSAPRLDAAVANRTLTVEAVCPGWAFLSCSTDLEVRVPAATKVTVYSLRGPNDVEGITGPIEARSDRAAVRVSGASPDVRARSVEAAVDVTLTGPVRRLVASSETGDIRVTVPSGEYRTLDLESPDGKATSDGVRQAAGGTGEITVHSGRGTVSVVGRTP